MAAPKVLIVMADYGHDPTETAVPYAAFKSAGFDVQFATEAGKSPECDRRMLQGLTQKLLGASSAAVEQYRRMKESEECRHPLSWSAPAFSFASFDLVFFPGGHDKAVRQVIDSEAVHRLVADYFPLTRRSPSSSSSPSSPPASPPAASSSPTEGRKQNQKAVAAVCHGVMALAAANGPDGKSVLRDAQTTALPARFEQVAYWGTRAILGDYYKTYGAGSENVEDSVKKVLDDPKRQWKSSLGMAPFIVEDPTYNYISARFPNDAELLAKRAVELVQSLRGEESS